QTYQRRKGNVLIAAVYHVIAAVYHVQKRPAVTQVTAYRHYGGRPATAMPVRGLSGATDSARGCGRTEIAVTRSELTESTSPRDDGPAIPALAVNSHSVCGRQHQSP